MRILITGNQGYVGPIVARHLRRRFPQATLVGFDTAFFALSTTNAAVWPERVLDEQLTGDVRDVAPAVLAGVDWIVHLAAVSNDAMGLRFTRVTEDVNSRASIDLARKAASAGVKRFVFASSCSVYGFAPGGARKENDPTDPQTAYARSKLNTEVVLATADLPGMTVTCLRFGTACGVSDRLRLDLVLNDFVASAVTTGTINVLSDGTPWRPLIDVRDMARAIEWALIRDIADGGPVLSINVGAQDSNYQVRDLAAAVADQSRAPRSASTRRRRRIPAPIR